MYYDRQGRPSPLPVGPEAAKAAKTARYLSDEVCPTCGKRLFYTRNNKCVHCARTEASDLYCYAIGTMRFDLCPPFHALTVFTPHRSGFNPNLDRLVRLEYMDEVVRLRGLLDTPAPKSPREAAAQETELWLHPEPCKDRGHVGLRTFDGECYMCRQEIDSRKPRKDARKNGETWYMPLASCEVCGTLSLRNTYTDRCQGCAPLKPPKPVKPPAEQSPESIMMEAQPDLIISKKDAKALKMKVYRTGRPCKKGHKGYRYVSTGNCIPCHQAREQS